MADSERARMPDMDAEDVRILEDLADTTRRLNAELIARLSPADRKRYNAMLTEGQRLVETLFPMRTR